MLLKKVQEVLNQQIEHEAYASSLYLSMAVWCEREGLRGCAGFFYEQSDEEHEHMLKLVKFINLNGGQAVVSAVKEPTHTFKSLQEVFELSFDQELNVTKQINKLVDLSLNSKDYASFNFLQWFVVEQQEEEKLFRTILDIIKLAGKEGRPLLLIDNEIAKIRTEEDEK